jgi:hypothetical protein
MSKGIMGSHGTDDEDDNPVESMPPFSCFLGTRNETQLGSVLVVGQHSIEAKYFNTFYSFAWTNQAVLEGDFGRSCSKGQSHAERAGILPRSVCTADVHDR